MQRRVAEDYRTHGGLCPGFFALQVHHLGQWRYGLRPRILRLPVWLLYRVSWVLVRMFTGIEIPCEVRIGHRLRIEHSSDVVVNGNAVLGDDVVIRNGVTIGVRRTGEPGSPVLGDRVDVGAGAKILGAVTIGDDAVIGANAVVLQDVPPGWLAVGVPARVRPPRSPRADAAVPTDPAPGAHAARPRAVVAAGGGARRA